jgi:hypothetical protein
MKRFIRWTLALALFVAAAWNTNSFAQMFGETWDQTVVLAIQSDGTCRATNVTTAPRATMEQQIRMMERYQNMADADTQPAPGATEAQTKPFTDAELIQKVKAMREDSNERAAGSDEKLSVTVTNDTVRTEITTSFSSIEELLKDRTAFGEQMVQFENTRFEQDTNGHLRVTFTPQAGMQRYFKTMRSATKLTGVRSVFQLILPGKVLASGFPEIQDRTTGFTMDAKKDESLDAVMKLYEGPIVITAEAGALKLPQPLESKTLQRANRGHGEIGDDLALTDAGPGFAAEAQMITTKTIRVFPEGREYFKQGGQYFAQQTGTVVSARIFAPKGRTLQSVSDVRVLKATDDKGRGVAPVEEDESYSSYSGGSPQGNSTSVQLHLQLPLADAQAINEIAAEAIAVTAGAWKQMTLTNLQENATNEIDLAEVLPGAKLTITKFTSKDRQTTIQAQVKGPATVRRLDFQAKVPGVQQMNSSFNERRFVTKEGISTRTIYIQAYTYSENGEANESPVLVVRFPEDLRRESVKFKLTGLDLL